MTLFSFRNLILLLIVPFVACDTLATEGFTTSSGSTFDLYAYGQGISGAQLFYSDGKAQMGNQSLANGTSIASVYFTQNSSALYANPNTTATANSTWSNERLYIAGSSSSGSAVGFTSSYSGGNITDEFIMYGSTVLVNASSGDLESMFYAIPVADKAGLWLLMWNLTDAEQTRDAAVAVSLRKTAPSN